MKVAIFTNNYLPRISGVSVAVDFLDRSLKTHDHETFVIAPDYGFDPEVSGVAVHRVKSISIQRFKFALALQDLEQERILGIVEGFQPDVIHSSHPFLLGDTALRAADEFRIPLVYTFHTLYDFFAHYVKLDFPAVRRKVREFVGTYADQCDLVVAPTEPIRQYLDELGVSSQIAVVPTGLDSARFRRVTPSRVEALRRLYGLERFDAVLLAVGRITKEKNVQLCLEVLGELTRRGRNICLLIFGEGHDSDSLVKDARQRGLDERLILGGFLDQESLAAAYALGSVFLFPSASDTQGIVLYEAWAAGLPILATDSMASRAIVKPNRNGLIAPPSPGSFADAVEEVLEDPDRFTEPFAFESFSHQHIGGIYSRLLRKTVDRGRTAGKPKGKRFKELVEEIRRSVNGEPRTLGRRRSAKRHRSRAASKAKRMPSG